MNLKFWKRKKKDEPEVANVRTINDIEISVATGLHGTRTVKITGWNAEMTYDLFQRVWSQLDGEEK